MKPTPPPRGETGPNYTLVRRRTKTLTSTSHRYQAAKANPGGARAPLKVVYVVLESQYQSSMSAAVKAINDNENSGVACECVGYLLEELRDPANAAAFKKDVEEANVFIGAISASRGAAVPSRHRRASSPGDEVVGGLFFDFEAVRTESSDRDAPRRCRPRRTCTSTRRSGGGGALCGLGFN